MIIQIKIDIWLNYAIIKYFISYIVLITLAITATISFITPLQARSFMQHELIGSVHMQNNGSDDPRSIIECVSHWSPRAAAPITWRLPYIPPCCRIGAVNQYIGCWRFTSWQHLGSHHIRHRLVKVCNTMTILLPPWEIMPPASWTGIPICHIIPMS